MTSSRKTPGVSFWATVVVVVVLVAYPMSVGPICWLEARGYFSPEAWEIVWGFYAPLRWFCTVTPDAVSDCLDWWAGVCIRWSH